MSSSFLKNVDGMFIAAADNMALLQKICCCLRLAQTKGLFNEH
jgi:hypothetical protein